MPHGIAGRGTTCWRGYDAGSSQTARIDHSRVNGSAENGTTLSKRPHQRAGDWYWRVPWSTTPRSQLLATIRADHRAPAVCCIWQPRRRDLRPRTSTGWRKPEDNLSFSTWCKDCRSIWSALWQADHVWLRQMAVILQWAALTQLRPSRPASLGPQTAAHEMPGVRTKGGNSQPDDPQPGAGSAG